MVLQSGQTHPKGRDGTGWNHKITYVALSGVVVFIGDSLVTSTDAAAYREAK